jgi:hypothetical protein
MCRSLIGQLQGHTCNVLPKTKWMCVLRLQNWPVCALCFCIYHFPCKDKLWNQSSIKSLKNLFHKLWKFLEVAISIVVNNNSIEFGSEFPSHTITRCFHMCHFEDTNVFSVLLPLLVKTTAQIWPAELYGFKHYIRVFLFWILFW